MKYVSTLVAFMLTMNVSGQNLFGTYTAPNDSGELVTLVFDAKGDNSGGVVGTLTGNGIRYSLDGTLEAGNAVGVMSWDEGRLWFEAFADDDVMFLVLAELDPEGQPNIDTATELVFNRQLSDVASSGGSNMKSSENPLARNNAGDDPFVGTFSDGYLTVSLSNASGQYSGQATFDGQTYRMTASGTKSQLSGQLRTNDGDYPFTITPSGNQLIVVSEGTQYTLSKRDDAQVTGTAPGEPRKQAGANSTGSRELAPGFTLDSAEAKEWTDWLGGMKLTWIESYTSGSAGGYSSRSDIYLCSNRQFSIQGQSTVAVDTGGAFGNAGEQGRGRGNWFVITNGPTVVLVLEYADGTFGEYRMEYIDEKTYASGERVYVTPAEVCG